MITALEGYSNRYPRKKRIQRRFSRLT